MRRSLSYLWLVLFLGCALLVGQNDNNDGHLYTLSDEYRKGREVTLVGVIGNTGFSAFAKHIHGEKFSPGIREAVDLDHIYQGKTILARSYGEVPVVSIYVGSGLLPYPILRKSCMDDTTLRYLVGESVVLKGRLVERFQFPGLSDKKYKAVFGKKLTVVDGPNGGKTLTCEPRLGEDWTTVVRFPKGRLVFPRGRYTDQEVREGRVLDRYVSSLKDSQLKYVPKHQFRYVRHYKNWVFPPEFWSQGNANFAMLTAKEFDKLTGKEHRVTDAQTARRELWTFQREDPISERLAKKLAARNLVKQTRPKLDRALGSYWEDYYTTPDEPGKFEHTGKFPSHHETAFMIFYELKSVQKKPGPGDSEYHYEIIHRPVIKRIK